MTFYQDNHIRIFNKDCRSMDELPDESVQCVVTSPPYWGLRKYSGEQDLIWGGDNHCQHEWVDESFIYENRTGLNLAEWSAKYARGGGKKVGQLTKSVLTRGICSLCGAWRGAFGLEPTPELYIEHTIEILREIKRVLRKDGVCFLNIGDSYWGGKGLSGQGSAEYHKARTDKFIQRREHHNIGGHGVTRPSDGRHAIIKPLDLCLIPQRLSIALQEDGWYVRSWIIWSKPNPMPESVNGWRWERHRVKIKKGIVARRGDPIETGIRNAHYDAEGLAEWQDCPGCKKCSPNDGYVLRKGSWRPTESHEYILMLTKTDTYYCDADAVREPQAPGTFERYGKDSHIPASPKWEADDIVGKRRASMTEAILPNGRNLRSVWEFPTQPYPEAHFAVFPEKLPELCIKAATPEVGCCSKCGAPWARIVKHHRPDDYDSNVVDEQYAKEAHKASGYDGTNRPLSKIFKDTLGSRKETLGWQPTCKCNAPRVPSLVLDPMMGAGTTLWKAKTLNRYGVGYEISAEYCQLAGERCRQQVLG